MLEIKKISRGFQITLPKSFREKFHLDIGDMVEIIEEDGKFTLHPLRSSYNPVQKLLSFLDQLEDSTDDEQKILEDTYQQRRIIRKTYENHY